jgi:hypothetical protein
LGAAGHDLSAVDATRSRVDHAGAALPKNSGNTPKSAVSPAFNYAFKRDDNTIKFGVNFYFP